ncbi:MAG: carbohydrate ABC transporter permease, partial [Lachnospiraceae bacterium]|nr:carbohydrate ABC transporter permease [Lachnospiraceae bacterium]
AFTGKAGLSLFFSSLAGYVLSRERLKGRSFLTACFVFTMMFSGGMIPNYILVRSLHMLDTLWSLFLPNVINVYNMLIIKTAFEGTPPALEESAKVDGASNPRIFLSIMFPMIAPSVAAVSLFLAVGYWNEYWSAILYITKNGLKPIQLYLLDVVNYASDPLSGTESTFAFQDAPEGIKSATIIVATLPILALYPFVQKYFVKGVMIGSVKE